MAATVTTPVKVRNFPTYLEYVDVSTIEEGVSITVSHTGPTGVAPTAVWAVTTTVPDGRSPLVFAWTASDTSADTATVVFDTVPGGSVTNGVARVFLEFVEQASGGMEPNPN